MLLNLWPIYHFTLVVSRPYRLMALWPHLPTDARSVCPVTHCRLMSARLQGDHDKLIRVGGQPYQTDCFVESSVAVFCLLLVASQ